MAEPRSFWKTLNHHQSSGWHRAIVGDPQADGGPNPELVEASGPIRVTPLRNMPQRQAHASWARLPHYAYGEEEDSGEEDEGDTPGPTSSRGSNDGSEDDADDDSAPPPAPPTSSGDSTTGVDEDYFDSIDDSTVPPAPPEPVRNTSAPAPTPSLSGFDTDPLRDSPKTGPIPGDDFPPSLPRPDFRADDNSLLQPEAVKGQQSTVNDTPSPSSPPPPEQWSEVNAQRSAAHPSIPDSLAPAVPGPSVNDVLDYAQRAGYSPEQAADAVKEWHRRAVDNAQKNGSDQGYFAGAMQADRDAQNALDTVRQFSDHPDDEANPAFAIPRQPTSASPIYGSNGQPVAYFQPRFRRDGPTDVLVKVPGQAGSGGTHGLLNVPAVTYNDIVNAAKQAALDHVNDQSRADQLEEDAQRSFSAVGGGDAAEGGGVGLHELAATYRQKAQDAGLRSDQLSNPQNAFALLTSERAADALRQSPLAEHVGQGGFTGLAQSFYTPIVGMVYNGAATMLDAVGDTAGRDRARQDFRDFRAAAPGYSRGDFQGGWSALPGQVASVAGSIAPVVLSGPYAPITAGLQTAGSSDTRALDAADELRQKAQQAQSAGDAATAQQFQKQAQDIENTRGLYSALSTALAVGGSAAIPKLARGASAWQAAGRGALEMGGLAGAQDQLDRGFLNQSMSPGQAATQILLGAGLGAGTKAFESSAPALGPTEAAPGQTFPAARDAQGRITVDGGDASPHPADGAFQGEIPPPAPGGPNAHLAISGPGDGSGAGSGEAAPPAPLKADDGSSDVYAKPVTAPVSSQETATGPGDSPAPSGVAPGGLPSTAPQHDPSAPDSDPVSATMPTAPDSFSNGPQGDTTGRSTVTSTLAEEPNASAPEPTPKPAYAGSHSSDFNAAPADEGTQDDIPPPAPGGPNPYLSTWESGAGSTSGSGEAVPPVPPDAQPAQELPWQPQQYQQQQAKAERPRVVNTAPPPGTVRFTHEKHHKNSESPEPDNVQDLWNHSLWDYYNRGWAIDSDGVIHRFSPPNNGRSHWNGSTAGQRGIMINDVPPEILKALKQPKGR